MIRAVSSAAARLISAQNTRAPSRAKATAVALPLPQPGPIEPAPTTSATFPLSRSTMSAAPATGRVEFAQLGLEDFPVIVLWKRAYEHVVLRALESCDVVEAQRIKFVAIDFAYHISDDNLTPLRIGPANHRHLADEGVLKQDLVDLARINIGAARNDDVLRPVFKCEITVAVERTDVAGVQPSVFERRGRSLGVAPIAGHDDVTTA